MVSDIREQIDKLLIHDPSCHALASVYEAADTMEKLLAVYEAAQPIAKRLATVVHDLPAKRLNDALNAVQTGKGNDDGS